MVSLFWSKDVASLSHSHKEEMVFACEVLLLWIFCLDVSLREKLGLFCMCTVRNAHVLTDFFPHKYCSIFRFEFPYNCIIHWLHCLLFSPVMPMWYIYNLSQLFCPGVLSVYHAGGRARGLPVSGRTATLSVGRAPAQPCALCASCRTTRTRSSCSARAVTAGCTGPAMVSAQRTKQSRLCSTSTTALCADLSQVSDAPTITGPCTTS